MVLSVALCAAAFAASLRAQPPAAAPPQGTTPPPASSQDSPDESFLEFLGEDDVGDASLWEFFQKAAPRADNSTAAPSQDAKQ